MQRDDGGNFSKDLLTRIAAMKMGSMSEDDLQQQEALHEKLAQDAINTAAGTMGSLKLVGAAPQMEMRLADRIRQAAQNSKVKGPEGGLTNNASMYQEGSPFQEAAKARFQELKEALRKVKGQ